MKPLLFALIIIIFIDLLTGIRKSHYLSKIKFKPWKKEFWKVIKSSELRKSWKKTTEYFIGIIVFIVLQMLVFKGLSVEAFGIDYSLAELAVVVACVVEVYSIYENMEAVSGNNLFKRVLNLLPTKIKDIFKSK
jgi:hypothetical protein